MTRREIEVGDTVVYTPAFLHSTGQIADDIAHYRGTVRSIEVVVPGTFVFARVAWTLDGVLVMDEDEYSTPWVPAVNVLNLARPLTARSVDIPLWASMKMNGERVTEMSRDAIEEDNRKRRESDRAVLAAYTAG
jgi:hypothetical protein